MNLSNQYIFALWSSTPDPHPHRSLDVTLFSSVINSSFNRWEETVRQNQRNEVRFMRVTFLVFCEVGRWEYLASDDLLRSVRKDPSIIKGYLLVKIFNIVSVCFLVFGWCYIIL